VCSYGQGRVSDRGIFEKRNLDFPAINAVKPWLEADRCASCLICRFEASGLSSSFHVHLIDLSRTLSGAAEHQP
jgi:hypothetical protein